MVVNNKFENPECHNYTYNVVVCGKFLRKFVEAAPRRLKSHMTTDVQINNKCLLMTYKKHVNVSESILKFTETY